jgi:hypothetical protein
MRRERDTFDLFAPRERGRFGDGELADARAIGRRVEGASDLVDLALVLHWQTTPADPDRGALLVSVDGREAAAVWVPKKFCEVERSGRFVRGLKKSGEAVQLEAVAVTLPQWVAKEKGLI